jgi:hypothetical protein
MAGDVRELYGGALGVDAEPQQMAGVARISFIPRQESPPNTGSPGIEHQDLGPEPTAHRGHQLFQQVGRSPVLPAVRSLRSLTDCRPPPPPPPPPR